MSKKNNKSPQLDVAKSQLTQILYLAHNSLNWGEDKEKALREIQHIAESAHNVLCVNEVIHGQKVDR